MQNKVIYLGLLLLAVAGFAPTAMGQEPASAEPKTVVATNPAAEQGLSPEAVREENKKRLEEELKNTNMTGKAIVDFPNRPSLGSLELAPLPGINETVVGGPLPMGKSVSGKDLPSEQLLGRITPEVFQEMADLERGNTFLKLQLEKERLKNDLEQMKATYRDKRLGEISKREEVVRSRIQWWQEQERLRLEIEKKQAEEEELTRQIAEKEAERNRLQEEARERMAQQQQVVVVEVPAPVPVPTVEAEPEPVQEVPVSVVPQAIEELYTIESIRGVGAKLSAKLRDLSSDTVFTVKRDDILPSGHVIREIKRDSVTVAYGNRIDQLVFRPNLP